MILLSHKILILFNPTNNVAVKLRAYCHGWIYWVLVLWCPKKYPFGQTKFLLYPRHGNTCMHVNVEREHSGLELGKMDLFDNGVVNEELQEMIFIMACDQTYPS